MIPETIITTRKRSLGKLMFLHLSVSHSVHSGEGGLPKEGVSAQGDGVSA